MSVPLFDALAEVAAVVRAAPHVLLFCDFEVSVAEDTSLPPATCGLFRSLVESGRYTVSLVSGKPHGEVRSCADVPGLVVVGNFGLEVSHAGDLFVEPSATDAMPALQLLADALTKACDQIPGATVENNGLSVSVSERDVDADQHAALRSAVHVVLAGASHPFALTASPSGYDIRPRVYWDKAAAVGLVRDRAGAPDAAIIYIGAHPTDEEAFAVLPDAITVRVGPVAETAAKFRLDGPDDVRRFLAWLAEGMPE